MTMKTLKRWFLNVLIAIDRLCNAIFGGDSKETMSTRVGRYKDTNWIANKVYQFLDWIDPGHCEQALKYDYSPDHTRDEVLK